MPLFRLLCRYLRLIPRVRQSILSSERDRKPYHHSGDNGGSRHTQSLQRCAEAPVRGYESDGGEKQYENEQQYRYSPRP